MEEISFNVRRFICKKMMSMEKEELVMINLKLNTLENLFIVPDYNPFDSQSRFQSGVDEIMTKVRHRSLKEPLKIRITLLRSPVDTEIEQDTKNALNRYCSFKIRECEQTIDKLQDQGKRDLVWALSLSVILILGAFFTSQLQFLPDYVRYFLETGLGIIAWVVLWPPLDSILYEWRPCRRSQRIYKYIQSATLDLDSAYKKAI